MKLVFKLTTFEVFGVKHRNCIFVGVNHLRCNFFRCKSYASSICYVCMNEGVELQVTYCHVC